MKTFDALEGGAPRRASRSCRTSTPSRPSKAALPQAQVMQIDTQANVIQALESGGRRRGGRPLDRRWLAKRHPDKLRPTAGKNWYSMLYCAALRQGDPDWLQFVNTTFDVAMFGHQNAIFDQALEDFFGLKPPVREPGLPPF